MSAEKDYYVAMSGPQQAELMSTVRDAQPLGPRDVAGRTVVTLISAGTELQGSYLASDGFPRRPGYAAVFRAETVGAEVSDIKPGDHVFCMGPHQSYQRFRREEVVPLPEGLAPEEAVFARMMGVTMTTLTTTRSRPPEKVLVTGLGLVGHLGAKIFASCGYRVTAVDPSPVRRRIAQEAGIQPALAAVPLEDPDIAGKIGLVLECSGHEEAALHGCRVVRKGGEVVLVGTPWRRRTDIYAHELVNTVFFRYVVLRSGWEWELPMYPEDFRVNSIFGSFEAALNWLAEGRINVSGIYKKVPPRQAQEAYQDLLHGRCEKLAVIFDWADCP